MNIYWRIGKFPVTGGQGLVLTIVIQKERIGFDISLYKMLEHNPLKVKRWTFYVFFSQS